MSIRVTKQIIYELLNSYLGEYKKYTQNYNVFDCPCAFFEFFTLFLLEFQEICTVKS